MRPVPHDALDEANARIRDLERQLAESHAQILELVRTANDAARATGEAARRVLAVERQSDKRRSEDDVIHAGGLGRPRGPQPARWGGTQIPQRLVGRSVEAAFDEPAPAKPTTTAGSPNSTATASGT